MTFHAQALVRTDRPSRYGAQLAKHLGHKIETEWSAEAGFVKLTDGVCDMHAWPEGLRLDAYADTYDGLAHVEDVVKLHLERWGENDTLKVEWQLRTPLPHSTQSE